MACDARRDELICPTIQNPATCKMSQLTFSAGSCDDGGSKGYHIRKASARELRPYLNYMPH